jgi:hypothetical protein
MFNGFFLSRRTTEKRVPRKEGEEGYDPYDFDESEATASEGKCVVNEVFIWEGGV